MASLSSKSPEHENLTPESGAVAEALDILCPL